jgi:polysaccharide export outer membrane protein
MRAAMRLPSKRPAKSLLPGLIAAILIVPLSACGGGVFFGADGPSTGRIMKTDKAAPEYGAVLLEVNEGIATRLADAQRTASFADVLGEGHPYGTMIGAGDTLEVTIYEAPPAVLFGAGMLDAGGLSAGAPQRPNLLPSLQVSSAGTIEVPFAGTVRAAGRTPEEVSRAIISRLAGKAHSPQVIVNIAENPTSAVTVVGEVTKSTRMSLTPKGERLLDALAASGGTRDAVDKVSVQITRGDSVVGMPLESVIRDPRQNVFLRPGDIVTAYFQSRSFTVLGAAGKNEEIKFEAQGITLAQALGRIGGIRDDRANPHGVFIFRFEDAAVVDPARAESVRRTPEGKIPVIYRVDLRNPVTFFAAQHFMMRDHDVVFVTSAPSADLQKFVNIIGAAIYPLATVKSAGL